MQETGQLARQLTEDAETLEVDTDGDLLSDKLAVMVTAELGRLMATLLGEEKDPEKRWVRLREIHGELSQLRRDDHRAAKVKLERKRREAEELAALEAETKRLQEEGKSKNDPWIVRTLGEQDHGPHAGPDGDVAAWGNRSPNWRIGSEMTCRTRSRGMN